MTLRHVLLEPARLSVGTQAKGNNPQAEEHRVTWEREMERAQLAAFAPPGQTPLRITVPEPTHLPSVGLAISVEPPSPKPVPAKPVSERTEQLAEALRGFGCILAMETTFPAPARGSAADGGFDPLALDDHEDLIDFDPLCAGTAVLANVIAGSPAVATHGAIPGLAMPQRAAAVAVLQQSDSPSIRLHADWAADGVRLWLGLDSSVLGHMSAIVDQVRQSMRGQGVRLLSLACNGQLIEDEAAAISGDKHTMPGADAPYEKPKENKPWPSVQ